MGVMKALWILGVSLLWVSQLPAQDSRAQETSRVELNTLLMESTFKIEGQGSIGTGFLLGRSSPNRPGQSRAVLVTAAHVLEDAQGEQVTLVMRRKRGPQDWERLPLPITIRNGATPRWTKHPDADVAVMYVAVPPTAVGQLLPTTLLAEDAVLAELEIHPGDELNCLGYPFGQESNPAGFAVLRSGKIASYPLLPTKETKTFLLDFRVFNGNSGGPVYFVDANRVYGGRLHLGVEHHFLMGLVTSEIRITQEIQELYGRRQEVYPLALAQIVHASLIREAINLLPPPE